MAAFDSTDEDVVAIGALLTGAAGIANQIHETGTGPNGELGHDSLHLATLIQLAHERLAALDAKLEGARRPPAVFEVGRPGHA